MGPTKDPAKQGGSTEEETDMQKMLKYLNQLEAKRQKEREQDKTVQMEKEKEKEEEEKLRRLEEKIERNQEKDEMEARRIRKEEEMENRRIEREEKRKQEMGNFMEDIKESIETSVTESIKRIEACEVRLEECIGEVKK